ncbi:MULTISPECIES: S1C family serine protease [unclassified Oceanispirochaeta]|uniref:S1C family serine protease n=1 Tax=unclassified Oceanispirochaeta TaxID=2635722 RepID=UPI000E097276|nr:MULTISPECIES: trypsin-like peptidase domain-containing protein [unclassified Oceanispirochaeta]MBF9018052.1 trypsin-like peptidase domain-containing protein [Oceanispirochaeta sp. M2]NPD73867.1 trypsin-like serine protease [Oceanispirochaeta sp. M1]RDG30328.1 PDZ domain-containing protein [Oceanispirochaeta sp. M1]
MNFFNRSLILCFLSISLFSCMTAAESSTEKRVDALSSASWSDPELGEGFEEPPLPEIKTKGLTDQEINSMEVYRNNIRAIVNVTTINLYNSRFVGSYAQEGSGSGVIVSGLGYILTNKHVISDADYVVVTLYDGSNYQAKLIGSDAENDLAVIKFEPVGRGLQTIKAGSSKGLQVGQKVLALGNPFGLEGTLTTGIISGLNRPLQTEAGFLLKGMIQTDAAINPGNSGGALLNSRGELIGINTMIISPGGMGSVGIGFAIPVETALRIVPELIEAGRVNRGWIDIEALSLTPNLARQLKIPFIRYGVLITSVLAGGNAENAGLRGGTERRGVGLGLNSIAVGGDIITNINGKEIKNVLDYFSVLEVSRPGEEYDVVYLRDGRLESTSIILSERPQEFQF